MALTHRGAGMRVLFVHQNFPGQYKHLAPALAARGDTTVKALAITKAAMLPGIDVRHYAPDRGTTKDIHPWVSDLETKVIRGEAAARAALRLKAEGFEPDVICAHPGWGEALFLKDVFPNACLLAFIEFYYQSVGADYGFDPEFSTADFDGLCRLRLKNANNLLNLDACDWAVSPTEWQKSTVPAVYQRKMSVIFDGIDTDRVRPNPSATVTLNKAGVTLRPGDEVITFVNRNMEPYRGFQVFMRALPEIQRRRPRAWTIIVGGDEVSYGRQLEPGQTYRKIMLEEVGGRLDMDRVRFVGRVPYADFVRILQVSAVHVYLTYPFVLSWSMLEAMSAGCLVVGSATPPVKEVIRDGENGLLVDFFSTGAIADAIDRVLDHPERLQALRMKARQTIVDRYDLRRVCLPRHLALVEALAAGDMPPKVDAMPIATAAAMQRAFAAKRAAHRGAAKGARHR
jgi:glycosyltransferase involved in cell wall biosynthesis